MCVCVGEKHRASLCCPKGVYLLGLTPRFTLTHTMGDKSGYDQTLSYDLSKASSPIDKGNIPECINAFVLDISHSSLI